RLRGREAFLNGLEFFAERKTSASDLWNLGVGPSYVLLQHAVPAAKKYQKRQKGVFLSILMFLRAYIYLFSANLSVSAQTHLVSAHTSCLPRTKVTLPRIN
ncbi:hypothetical protein, partial [Planococcus sp. CAU13]|uniref:hypothetical protein n=1 Tax=Planococcus sp. CAU13 TaxID=1541197 RepID=UPI001F4140A6